MYFLPRVSFPRLSIPSFCYLAHFSFLPHVFYVAFLQALASGTRALCALLCLTPVLFEIRRPVRHKHVPGRVRNGKGQLAGQEDSLGRDTAGVKDSHFVRTHWYRVAPVRLVQVRNAEEGRSVDTEGCPVGVRILRCNGHVLGDLQGGNGLHGNDNVAVQATRRTTRKRGGIHGHVASGLRGPEGNARFLQRTIVGKGAANQKGYRVLRPVRRDIRDFFDQDAVTVNGVSVCVESMNE
jgi:hypothetical protein